ncbi:50S ribosomal protein L32 [Candidatus Dependentiae bacterium]|nr:50S ribosomal protein L32 [Candidatus Dependentiae bacterium]
MPVPKRKRSRARRDSRFANKGLIPASLSSCGNCKSPVQAHAICTTCGHYRGVKVMTTKFERTIKRTQKRQERQQQAAASAAE